MATRIGIGLLGLGTVGAGVAAILSTPEGRHPLIANLQLAKVAVRDINRPRPVELDPTLLTTDPQAVVDDPNVHVVVEVMGGIEPARTLIMRAIAAGKSVVTANKAVIARHGEEIAAAAAAAADVSGVRSATAAAPDAPVYFTRSTLLSKERKLKHPLPTYCTCNLPSNPDNLLICCDNCEKWFHGNCMGLNRKQADALDSWKCEQCS